MHEIQMLGLLEHDVLSSIEVPFLPEYGDPTSTPRESTNQYTLTREEADKFDMDVFSIHVDREKPPMLARSSYGSVSSGSKLASSYRSPASKGLLASHRSSLASSRVVPIGPIEESPRRILRDLPDEGLPNAEKTSPAINPDLLSTSPSQMSILSRKSNQSGRSGRSNLSGNTISSATEGRKRDTSSSRGSIAAKLAPSWLFNPFRSVPSQPQTSVVSASGVASPSKPVINKNGDGVHNALGLVQSPKPKPVTIRQAASSRANAARGYDDDSLTPHRNSFPRHSPLNVSPMKDPHFGKRNSVALSSTLTSNSTMTATMPSSHLPLRAKPLRLTASVSSVQSSLASRWQHMFPRKLYKREMKWQSLVTPGCLPLTVDYFPTTGELETSYDVVSYHFFVDPPEMKSFFIKPPAVKGHSHGEQRRRAWALVVMRQMASVRLAQGFQFVLRPETLDSRDTQVDGLPSVSVGEEKNTFRVRRSYLEDNNETPKPRGAAEVLCSVDEPVYLSMSNEIHSISYKNEYIEVKRYLRRMPPGQVYEYQCLIWPKLGVGYTEWTTSFTTQAMEAYGWNR
jgi:DEP domain-containing protein 5